eukprot:GFUD01029886.1.p2 GENE.GFUD01029886.1~~GFUD01029886.1.p2  ORF type:complete len:126 (+),score=26.81 GFUD01029886.1:56-379(+)
MEIAIAKPNATVEEEGKDKLRATTQIKSFSAYLVEEIAIATIAIAQQVPNLELTARGVLKVIGSMDAAVMAIQMVDSFHLVEKRGKSTSLGKMSTKNFLILDASKQH